MKRKFAIFSIILTFFAFNSFAEISKIDEYDYKTLVLSIGYPSEPLVNEQTIIFTQENKFRFAGIAFDFEDYKTIHPYQIRKTEDEQGNITNSVMFFILEKPENIEKICYRVILDGLWTIDPTNSKNVYDSKTGLCLSVLNIPKTENDLTEHTKDDSVHFVYNGEPGKTIRLAGNFTNWDSWIYTLHETRPGFYELFLHLPEGTYYYNYYSGFDSFQDKTNPNKVYTQDGKVLSVININ